MRPESASEREPEALCIYRCTLGAAADNEAVVLAEDVADGIGASWIDELDAYPAEQRGQLRDAYDFAAALRTLAAPESEPDYVYQSGIRLPRAGRRGVARGWAVRVRTS